MTDSLRGRCELFIGNRHILRKAFKFETTHTHALCSFLYANEKAIADSNRILKKKREIRKRIGALSNFASFSLLPISSLSALDPDGEEALDRALEVYGKLRKKVYSSSYLSLAAYLLAKYSQTDLDNAIADTVSNYDTLKRIFNRHRLGDDIVYAALLTIAGRTEAELMQVLGDCTLYLSPSISKQSVKLLSIVCTINGDCTSLCCQRFLALKEELEKNDFKIDKNDRYTLLHIFTLACIKTPESKLSSEILEIYSYLKQEKRFGIGFGRTQYLVYSILLLYGEYVPENESRSDPEIRSAVKGSSLSVLTSVYSVMCSEISWALAAISVI